VAREPGPRPACHRARVPREQPVEYVEIQGTAAGTHDDADDHIDRLTQKYMDQEQYPFKGSGEVRKKYVITPTRVRYQKQ
jgi:hypothetical protein